MTANNVDALEVRLDQARAAVNLKDDLIALQSNQAFLNVINKGYLEHEAIRLVKAKSNPTMQDEMNQKDLDNSIIAIGQLEQYFRKIIAMGTQMEKTIVDTQKEMDIDDSSEEGKAVGEEL